MPEMNALIMCLQASRYSQSQLAEMLGLQRATINHWCTLKTPIPEKKITSLCQIFKIDKELLVDNNRYPNTNIDILDNIICYYDKQTYGKGITPAEFFSGFDEVINYQKEVEVKRKKLMTKLRRMLVIDDESQADISVLKKMLEKEERILEFLNDIDSQTFSQKNRLMGYAMFIQNNIAKEEESILKQKNSLSDKD